MSARFVSASLIRQVVKNGKALDVQVVDKTALWTRPSGFPSAGVKDDFVALVEENASIFSDKTAKVAMKYVLSYLSHSTCLISTHQLILKQGIRASE